MHPQPGRAEQLTPHITRVLAPNPGPMTLDGTNTWILRAGDTMVVVDPGPDLDPHLQTVAEQVAGAARLHVLLTHHHLDHSEGMPRLIGTTGAAPLELDDGVTVDLGEARLTALATPGHTADSQCFVLERPDHPVHLLTGDTVLGRGTAVVAHPDGSLADYLTSLARLREDLAARGGGVVLPGHGPVVENGTAVIETYLAHRQERLEQVRAAVAAGARGVAEVVQAVYADVDPSVLPAAARSVAAQLEYLEQVG